LPHCLKSFGISLCLTLDERKIIADRVEWQETKMEFVLWIIAVILVIAGIVSIVRAQLVMGIVLIVVGLLVGPGGVSLFTK
jgi:hypothetical protein